MQRRDALAILGATASLGTLGSACPVRRQGRRLDRIGVQLYTVRAELRRDFDGTLARVAAIGYREVEFAGYMGRTPRQVREALDRYSLTAPATHLGIEAFERDWPATLEAAQAIGHRYLVVPWVAEQDRRTLDGWRRVGERFTRAAEAARAAGLEFLYHNHDFEFTPLEGRIPFDVLLESTDRDLVRYEMDLFWIAKGGQDPLAYFARWPGRFPCVHVKDMDAEGRMVDVGRGRLDFAAMFARSEQAGIRHYFVEHDEPGAPFDSIRSSYGYLRELRF
jgi:sugar phosphate isomerase/epimerase